MTALTCPFCSTLATFGEVWSSDYSPPLFASSGIAVSKMVALQCPNERCHMVVTAAKHGSHLVRHWPLRVSGKSFPDVPAHIAGTADEAHLCMSVGAYRGAVALARAVVEATAKERGVMNGNLMHKIDKLAEQRTISQAMRDAAHEVRFAGNEVAHGDLAEQPLEEADAEEVVELMDAILLRVYQEPAQVARVREKREARKALP